MNKPLHMPSKKPLTVLALALVGALAASAGSTGVALASPGERAQKIDKVMTRLDTDRDGRISRAEAEAGKHKRLAHRFDRLDSDKNGFVTRAELEAAPSKLDRVFGRLDADRDGRISRAEAERRPGMARRFDKLDADRDGFVTRAEMKTAMERHRAEKAQRKADRQRQK